MSLMTVPLTSVSRMSPMRWWKVSCSWSMPSKCRQVVDRRRFFLGSIAEFIRATVVHAAPGTSTGKEHAESTRIVGSPDRSLVRGHAAKLASPDDKRFDAQSALIQVLDQPGNRVVYLRAMLFEVLS